MSLPIMIKKPSAYLPVAMSWAALALVLRHHALFGPAPQADEGAAAHFWQLLMAVQVPIVAFFAPRWLPLAPRPALLVLVLQIGAGALCEAKHGGRDRVAVAPAI